MSWNQRLRILGMMLLDPWFDPTEIERVQKDMHQAQDSIEDDPEALSWDLAWNGLFQAPLGPSQHGDGGECWTDYAGTIAFLSSQSDSRFQSRHWGVRSCGPRTIENLIGRRLGRIPSGQKHPLSPPVIRDRFRSRPRRKLTRSGAPASVVIDFRVQDVTTQMRLQ